MTELRVQLLDADLTPPTKLQLGDAGIDLRARTGAIVSSSTGPVAVPTGVAVEIPPAHVGLVCSRSGLAASHGIAVLNAPGVVDAGYRGEVVVVLFSVVPEEYCVRRGERIAQLLVQPIADTEVVIVDVLSKSQRGAGGLGSTGR